MSVEVGAVAENLSAQGIKCCKALDVCAGLFNNFKFGILPGRLRRSNPNMEIRCLSR